MKKLIAIGAIILVIGGFVVFQKMQSANVSEETNEFLPESTSQASNAPGSTSPSSGTGNFKDGSYTGIVGSASQYGDVQVKVTVSGGKITAINLLKFPDAPGHTTEVSNMALPILKQEAIAAQSAKIDNVTGATQTTEGFIQSLQSALDQAKV